MTTKPIRVFPPRVLLSSTVEQSGTVGASSIYRFAAPADMLRRTGFATTLINYGLPNAKGLEAAKPDSVVLHNHYTDQLIEAVKTYRRQKGLFIAYDIDDLFWQMDSTNPNVEKFPSDILSRIRKTCAQVDIAIASTPIMAEYIKKSLGFGDNRIKIVRNQLPSAFITTALAAKPTSRTSSKPRIGWAGGSSHVGDLALLKETVEATAEEFQWVFMDSMPDVNPAMVEFHSGVPFEHYPAKLASLDLDLALAPLADTAFNSCKSDLRVLEYAACGYPVLASKSPAFQDVPELQTVPDHSAQTWIHAIRWLLADRKGLDDYAQTLHDWVKSNRVLNSTQNLKRWAWAWTPDSQEVFEPKQPSESTDVVVVGEPLESVDIPNYRTIKDAREVNPNASVIYIRPGTVPTGEQIATFLNAIGNSVSACVLSNDADYPAPGQFAALPGKTRDYMAEAALNNRNSTPIPVPYATGPLTYLSNKALDVAGIPDEERYQNDIDTAIIDWCARLRDMGLGGHVALPNLFVPVVVPSHASTDAEFTKAAIREIATWHSSFQSCEQETLAAAPKFAEARANIDRNYACISYEGPRCATYNEWSQLHDTLVDNEWAEEIEAELSSPPSFSIVIPVFNTPSDMLLAATNSVINQTYKNWELILLDDGSTDMDTQSALTKVVSLEDSRITITRREVNGHISEASNSGLNICKNDWVFFLDHDDELSPYMLSLFADAINNNPNATMLYGDSDMLSPEGDLHSPDFKPDFDYDLFLGQNYVRGCYRTQNVKSIGGFRTEFNGSQDYDLTLRYIEQFCWWKDFGVNKDLIEHIPFVTYHWRQSPNSVSTNIANKPYAIDAARRSVLEHMKRIDRPAFIGPHPQAPMHNIVRFLTSNPQPKVSIIILTQLDRRRLTACLESISKNTNYSNYEVVVRQVGDDPGIRDAIQTTMKKDKRVKYVTGGGHAATFNFALLNNTVVNTHIADDSEVLVFLNDDTQIATDVWLADMVGAAMRPDIGAVGVKLIYPNGHVQHNGIIIDPDAASGEYALHVGQGLRHNDGGSFGRAVLSHQNIAVTAACMAIRRELFAEMKGFDAVKFPLDYNDVDLCMRLHTAGYSNVVLSHVVVVHHEGGTKRANPLQVNRAGMIEKEMLVRSAHEDVVDPYVNPNTETHPLQNVLRTAPYRPWRPELNSRVLVIGAEKSDVHTLYRGGELPFSADTNGPWLHLAEPVAEHGGTIDLRNRAALTTLLEDLAINRVILRRLKNGSVDVVLGALVDIGHAGMSIEYVPDSFEMVCPRLDCTNSEGACGHKWKLPTVDACQACIDRDGSPYGSVNVAGWRLAWDRFSKVLNTRQEIDDENVVLVHEENEVTS